MLRINKKKRSQGKADSSKEVERLRRELDRRTTAAERERREMEDRYRKYEFIVNTTTHFMTLISREYVYEAANDAFCRAVGRSRENVLGKSVMDIWGEKTFQQEIKRHLDRCFSGEVVEQYQAAIQFPALGLRQYEVMCNPYLNAAGDVTHAVVVSRDVSDRLAIDNQLWQRQKLDSIALLSGGIAHDFNNLLTVIIGNVGLAETAYGNRETVTTALRQAELAAFRARDLTEKLQSLSRGGVPLTRVVSTGQLVQETVRFVLTGSQVTAVFALPDDLWMIEADEAQIGRVIQNIALNAVQSMPTGGTIRVTSENITIRPVERLPLLPGRYVCIRIQDEGCGIAQENLHRIFDPYYTTKDAGSGLGLAMCYSTVMNHGGYIGVQSIVGKGTEFSVFLPATTVKSITGQSESQTVMGQGNILLMDDEELVRAATAMSLKGLGYQVQTAQHGDEAVDLYTAALRSAAPFALVILDLTVPGRAGAESAIQRFLAVDPNVKAILSSGYRDHRVVTHYRDYGFCSVVRKPYKLAELSKAIQDALHPAPGENSPATAKSTARPARILLVDDNSAVCEVAARMLTAAKYEVTSETSAIDALTMFKKSPASFDLVITDQVMPDMLGTELADKLREIVDAIPIILITGHPQALQGRDAESLGIQAIVAKPLMANTFCACVQKVLDQAKEEKKL